MINNRLIHVFHLFLILDRVFEAVKVFSIICDFGIKKITWVRLKFLYDGILMNLINVFKVILFIVNGLKRDTVPCASSNRKSCSFTRLPSLLIFPSLIIFSKLSRKSIHPSHSWNRIPVKRDHFWLLVITHFLGKSWVCLRLFLNLLQSWNPLLIWLWMWIFFHTNYILPNLFFSMFKIIW